jgi:hypothetical protein
MLSGRPPSIPIFPDSFRCAFSNRFFDPTTHVGSATLISLCRFPGSFTLRCHVGAIILPEHSKRMLLLTHQRKSGRAAAFPYLVQGGTASTNPLSTWTTWKTHDPLMPTSPAKAPAGQIDGQQFTSPASRIGGQGRGSSPKPETRVEAASAISLSHCRQLSPSTEPG